MHNKNFNIIISGVGGQGIITLVSIMGQAAFIEGADVRSSELHGLSQRGGAVLAHVRFGKKVFSPLVPAGQADLVLGLDLLEGLRSSFFAGPKTKFLINKYSFPMLGGLTQEEIIKKLPVSNLFLVSASEICRQKLQKEVMAGVYLLGYACKKGMMPMKKESFLKAIENCVPNKYKEINLKAFNLGYDN